MNEESTAEFFSIVQIEGNRNVKRNIQFYNLDAIIAVGYMVNSKKATKFR
ncbi:MAG: RhuM family protein [Anaerorhabdus sp.]